MESNKMRMFMKCNSCGKFIKLNVEEIRAGVKDAKTWVMVENEEDATNDPGWIGQDHSMTMLQYVSEEYGCSSFTCHTPQADIPEITHGSTSVHRHVTEAHEQYKLEEEKRQAERPGQVPIGTYYKPDYNVSVLGSNRMGRKVALALAGQQFRVIAEAAVDLGTLYEDMARLNVPSTKNDWKVSRNQGFKPNHKQMKAMNRQMSRRSGGRRR